MQVHQLPIHELLPYARNPRKPHSAIAKVAASLKEFGWKQPIVVDRDKVIVVGHNRWLAAQQLGFTQVPVVVAEDLTPTQIKAYRLADNRTHEEAEWDSELLPLELLDLKDLAVDLALTAFDEAELKQLLPLSINLKEADECPELPQEPVSQIGDLWVLGEHRLLCGDGLQPELVAQVMGEERADLIFTDPPYNVDYEGCTPDKLKMAQDNLSVAGFAQFLHRAFAVYATIVQPTASFYVCHSSRYQREFQTALEANGWSIRTMLVWVKNTFAWGHGRYKYQHEPIFYGHVQGQTDHWYGDKTQSTVWAVDKPAANRLHPTMKPVALIEKALHNSSKAHDIVVDLFGGSGSTLIACEQQHRRARLMELEPRYTDVIIRRWQTYTGQVACLAHTSDSFEAVAARRATSRS